jgi:hypothetical protein
MEKELNEQLKEYRNHLVLAEQKAQEDYDKTVIALSGGGLGISFAFLENVVGTKCIVEPLFLFFSWVAWALSILCVLASFFTSHLALQKAIKQVDDGTIYEKSLGGTFNKITRICNVPVRILFVFGAIIIAIFVLKNIGE